jgi:acetyl-CoA acetyltransferase
MGSVWIAGSYQSDFARNYAREGLEISDMVAEAVTGTLRSAGLEPEDVESIHVGNAFGQLFTGQGQLGAMPATVEPRLWGKPAARPEAACASGSVAVLSATAEIEAGRYDCVLVLAVEQERNVPGADAPKHLGAAGVLLVSDRYRAERLGKKPAARIAGWGHGTAGLALQPKLDRSRAQPYVFPHVRQVVTDAFRRAQIPGVGALDGIETHDCFSMSEYMAIDHFGITEPGESWKAIENGELERDGAFPVNPSGGLIGVGHPVGATGVRMLHDAARQVTGQAGDCQVEGARTFATLNIGGSLTTTVSFVVTAE